MKTTIDSIGEAVAAIAIPEAMTVAGFLALRDWIARGDPAEVMQFMIANEDSLRKLRAAIPHVIEEAYAQVRASYIPADPMVH